MGLFESFIKKGWEKALYVTGSFRISPVMTFGPSMLPTIDSKPSIFLAERITIRFGQVARGDIVIVRSPENPRKVVAKRVVGMEGDTVTYLPNPKYSANRKTVVVPKGHVWVQGDNIYNSRDSRYFGPVPYGHIESRIFWKLLPAKDFGPFWKR